jgi:hypothetical protein
MGKNQVLDPAEPPCTIQGDSSKVISGCRFPFRTVFSLRTKGKLHREQKCPGIMPGYLLFRTYNKTFASAQSRLNHHDSEPPTTGFVRHT